MSTATAEPTVKKSLADLPALQPLDKAFGDALKAQDPQPEVAKPETKKPEAKPAETPKAEPEKAAAEKPAEPAKSEKPAKKKSALDAALSEDTPEVKPEVDEVQQLLESKDPNWDKARETMKRQSEELKGLRETAKKSAEPPPELAQKLKTYEADLARFKEENAKLRDSIVALDVRYEPEFQAKYVTGREKQVSGVAARVKAAGGDADAFVAAMELPLDKRAKALDAALQGIESPRELATINTKLGQIEVLDEERDSRLSDPHQSFEQMKQQRDIAAREHEAQVQQFKAATFNKVAQKLQKESPLFRPAPADSEGAEQFNADLKADMERAIDLAGDVSPEDATIAAYKARRFDTITKYMMQEAKAKDTRISELEETLAKFEGAEIGHRGGKKPTGLAPHEVPIEKAFFDALEKQQPV